MTETFTRGGTRYTIHDLSDTLSNATREFEPNPHEIQYLGPAETLAEGERRWGIGADFWPNGQAINADSVTATTHSGTHVDAPHHYGPADGRHGAHDRHDAPVVVLRPRGAAGHAREDAEWKASGSATSKRSSTGSVTSCRTVTSSSSGRAPTCASRATRTQARGYAGTRQSSWSMRASA